MTDPFFQKAPEVNKTPNVQNNNPIPQQPQIPQQQPPAQPIPTSTPPVNPVSMMPGLKGQPQKVENIVKQGSRVSMSGFLIGCGFFFVIFIGLVAGGLYYFATNPSQGQQFGLQPSTVKNLLTIFTILFFGFLFLSGGAILVVNGYRIFSNSEGSKVGNFFGAIFGILLFILSIRGGSWALSQVRAIDALDSELASGALFDGRYKGAKNTYASINDVSVKKIVPGIIQFRVNPVSLNKMVSEISPSSIEIDCDNGQKFNFSPDLASYECLYVQKKNYAPKALITFVDIKTNKTTTQSMLLDEVKIDGALDIMGSQGKASLNSGKNEYVVGAAPLKINLSAQNIISDLGVKDQKIERDINEDGKPDLIDSAFFASEYKTPGLFTINLTLPSLSNFVYDIPIRVFQSDTPVCTLTGSLDGSKLSYNVEMSDALLKPRQYIFEVVDISSDKAVYSTKSIRGNFSYDLSREGEYFVRTTVMFDGSKKTMCQSDYFGGQNASFNVPLDFQVKTASSKTFDSLSRISDQITVSGEKIIIKQLPATFRVSLSNSNGEISFGKVIFDGKQLFDTDGIYEILVSEDLKSDGILEMNFSTSDGRTQKLKRFFDIQQGEIIESFKVLPSFVGTDPYEVTLDVSSTKLIDPTDEIIYFTRVFGDGEISKNVSQGKTSHLYKFDVVRQAGDYRPQVTITTKKGKSYTFSPIEPISVKRALRPVKINIPSHPAQIANIGDSVTFSIETNGAVNSIVRDFGDGNTQDCEARSCMEMRKIYEIPGTYTIKTTVNYEDYPSITESVKLKVQ